MKAEHIGVYRACVNSDGNFYVEGPGDGFGRYSGALFPNMLLSSQTDAHAAALIANEAFRQGKAEAQRVMREAMGVKL